MLLALSRGHEIGLAVACAIFVSFALLSSFVFPRFNPDFPTRKGLRWYVPLSVLMFLGMMAAVVVLGREKKSAEAAAPMTTAAATTTTGTTTGAGTSTAGSSSSTTTTTTTTPSSGGKLTSGPYANGDPTAGKTVFTTATPISCSTCHTLKAAGATGTVGPNLDNLASDAAQAKQSLGEYTLSAILHPPPAYVPPGYPTNVMPKTFGTSLTKKQIADLVAFIDDAVSP